MRKFVTLEEGMENASRMVTSTNRTEPAVGVLIHLAPLLCLLDSYKHIVSEQLFLVYVSISKSAFTR